jgi:hypothetical protein
MRQPLTKTAWTTIPTTYVVCETDNAIPVAAQERMAKCADEIHQLGCRSVRRSPRRDSRL